MFGVILQFDVSINHWYCDHYEFAKSRVDSTPPVMHGCLSKQTSDAVFYVYKSNNLKHNVLSTAREATVLCNVPSPEYLNKKINVKVELIHVNQVITTATCDSLKLKSDFDVEFVLVQKMFGNDDMSSNIDATILLGNFNLEKND